MKTFNLVRKDLKKLWGSRLFRISFVVILIIPILYSLLYLDAFWDPYSRLDQVKIAIVNQDQGSTQEDYVNYGDTIVNQLKENHSIGWTFTTYEDAYEGLSRQDGYYAMIVIPEDFSSKVLSAKNDTPIQASLTFIENQKKNFIQTQINSKLLLELKESLSSSIRDEYIAVTYTSLDEIKLGMSDAAAGMETLTDAVSSAASGSAQLHDGMLQANDGITSLSDGLTALAEGATQAYDGSTLLSEGISQYSLKGIVPIAEGIRSLDQGLQEKLLPSASRLALGAQSLSTGLSNITTASESLSEGSKKLSTYATNSGGLQESASSLGDGSSSLLVAASTLSKGTDQLNLSLVSIDSGAQKVYTGLSSYLENVTNSQQTLQDATTKYLQSYLAKHPEATLDPDLQQFIATLTALNEKNTDENVKAQTDSLLNGAKALSEGTSTLVTGTQALQDGLLKYTDGAVSFSEGAVSYATGAAQYADAASSYAMGANQLSEGIQSAIVGSKQVSDGTQQLFTGLQSEFGTGLTTLANSTPLLESGATSLEEATKDLSDGLLLLQAGSIQAQSGTLTLSDGITALTTGSSELNDGLEKILTGSSTLATSLKDGSQELNQSLRSDSSQMSTFVSSPLTINETHLNPVDNYGKGFTPYFVALALWVGALLVFFITSTEVDSTLKVNPISYVLGKYITNGLLGTLQAVVVSLVVLNLKLEPNNIGLFFLTNILMSWMFIAIIQFLIYCFGDGGRVLAMALLILQLTSCAGTFPLEVVPHFFKVLNPFMPFTYTVSALREAISGVDTQILLQDYSVFAIFTALSLSLTILYKWIRPMEPVESTTSSTTILY